MIKSEENVPLKKFTTFKIGGPARYFFRVNNDGEAREALDFAKNNKLPFFVLGQGSNLLVSDEGFSGVIIKNEILGMKFSEEGNFVLALVGAGENWDNFVAETVKRGLYGLENLSGIPGTVGASPIQNIGAYGAEVRDTIDSVLAIDSRTSEKKVFTNEECQFSYRDSFFKTTKGKNYLVIKVVFRLCKNGSLNISYKDLKQIFNFQLSIISEKERENKLKAITLKQVRTAVLEIRKGKFPDLKKVGTAGSFFKNPIISKEHFESLKNKFPALPGFPQLMVNGQWLTVKVSLAWILDKILHYKGVARGDVGLHDSQPLVLVNLGSGTAEEVTKLAKDVAEKVKNLTGIELEWEVEKL